MVETRDAKYALTTEGKIAVWLAPLYSEAVSFIPKAIFLDDFLFGKSDRAVLPHLQDLVRRAGERWGVYTEGNTTAAKVHRQTARYLDGMLIGPSLVALFPPERPSSSFKELGGLCHSLIVGEAPTMRVISIQAGAMDGVFFHGFR